MSLVSRLIEGTKPEAQTIIELQQAAKLPVDTQLNMMVFETSFKEKKVYTCMSGGVVEDGQPKLTLVGRAALEALINLPLGNNEKLVFQELKLGPTPLREKVRAAIMRAESGMKICFIGDMQGELDGHMLKALNFVPGVIKVSH